MTDNELGQREYTRDELRKVSAEYGQIDGCDARRLLDALDAAEAGLLLAKEFADKRRGTLGLSQHVTAALEKLRTLAP